MRTHSRRIWPLLAVAAILFVVAGVVGGVAAGIVAFVAAVALCLGCMRALRGEAVPRVSGFL